jgi:transcriptional regulator with XRE-family HTH domain
MIESRHAVQNGVQKRTRGGVIRLCQSVGRVQVRLVFACSCPDVTTRRERQNRGSWKGELSLCLKAVLFVLRQPRAMVLSVNERIVNAKKTKPCSTQGVGRPVHRMLEKSGPASCGETVDSGQCYQDHILADPTPVAPTWGPYRPLPLANLGIDSLNIMINEALRLVRVFHNVKQKDLADALGLSPSHLSEIESGKKQVTMEILERYAHYFKIPASSLLYFAEHKNSHGGKHPPNPIAAKALKMLDWVETITRDDEEDDEETVSA